jgi:hypothetical protein
MPDDMEGSNKKNKADFGDVHVIHATEQKHGVVAHIRGQFARSHSQIRVFLDESSQKAGDTAVNGMSKGAPAGEHSRRHAVQLVLVRRRPGPR